jgi:hypothetical protein
MYKKIKDPGYKPGDTTEFQDMIDFFGEHNYKKYVLPFTYFNPIIILGLLFTSSEIPILFNILFMVHMVFIKLVSYNTGLLLYPGAVASIILLLEFIKRVY